MKLGWVFIKNKVELYSDEHFIFPHSKIELYLIQSLTRFYRAKVIDKLEDDLVKVVLVDVGVTVLVKHQCLFWLQYEFTLLPAQTIDIKFSSEYSSISEILELLNENQNYAWLEVSSSSLDIQLMPGKLSQTSRLSQRNIPSSQVLKRLMLNRIAVASDKN